MHTHTHTYIYFKSKFQLGSYCQIFILDLYHKPCQSDALEKEKNF